MNLGEKHLIVLNGRLRGDTYAQLAAILHCTTGGVQGFRLVMKKRYFKVMRNHAHELYDMTEYNEIHRKTYIVSNRKGRPRAFFHVVALKLYYKIKSYFVYRTYFFRFRAVLSRLVQSAFSARSLSLLCRYSDTIPSNQIS